MDHTKIETVYLDSPCRELSMRGLGFIVARFFSGVDFSCASTGDPTQLCPAI